MNIPELLAPVGSKEALTAAVQNGADAVYLGGKMFSARQYANNFDRDEMREAIEYAHLRGVKVYVTVNTLLADSEFTGAVEYLRFLYESGADAIIVQDLGIARVARVLLPELTLHASTQMTVHNSAGAEALKSHGFARVVLARELTLEETTEIKRKTGTETEVFVHGALCVCYSGQCLMSSMIGGRSGNRGRCAQPCRMEYTLVDEKGAALVEPGQVGSHLLSPMDLNMIKHIPELSEAGISSLKIEGRMKRPEYVAIVTRIYRTALDRYRQSPRDYAVDEKELKDLAQIFNRGFTTGYFFGKPGRDMMSYKRPNNRGLRLGRVTGTDREQGLVEVLLEDDLRQGDGIEFWVTEGGRRGIVVNRILLEGKQVNGVSAGQKAWIPAEGKIRPGDRVFKTNDAELMARAEESYSSSRELKKIPLHFRVSAHIGEPFEITVSDSEGHNGSAKSGFLGQEALNKPLTEEALRKQLDRLGNTPFSVGRLDTDIDGNVMVPVSEINETRRSAIDGLAAARVASAGPSVPVDKDFAKNAEQVLYEITTPPAGETGRGKSRQYVPQAILPVKTELSVRTDRLEILEAVAQSGAEVVYFGGANLQNRAETVREMGQALSFCHDNGVKLVICPPRIMRDRDMPYVDPQLEFAQSHGIPVLAANLGVLTLAVERQVAEVYADYPLNIYNSQALKWLEENYRIARATISPELTLEQIAGISAGAAVPLEALVQGHLPLMVTEYCPQGCLLGGLSESSGCKRPCKVSRGVGLKDRLGLVFPVTQDEFCRAYVHNAKELSMIEDIYPICKAGISRFRIETSIEDRDRVVAVVRSWRRELDRFARDPEGYRPEPDAKEKFTVMSPAGLTKGHYYRGVE